jgi:hypothetical protein
VAIAFGVKELACYPTRLRIIDEPHDFNGKTLRVLVHLHPSTLAL